MIQRSGSEPFALSGGRVISVDEFLSDVACTAHSLAGAHYLVNACENRYRFMVGFFAVAAAGATNLLPSARNAETFRRLARRYPGAAPLTDDSILLQRGGAGSAPGPCIPGQAVAAIAFTSGSTGAPQPHAKTWDSLCAGAAMHAGHLGLAEDAVLVATVPPWHMYGLEWTMLLATRAPVAVYCGEPFYPADVRRALGAAEGHRVMVTTPVHLRAMMRSAGDYPRVDTVICATAPLEQTLAEQVEQRLGATVVEIYGCSEAGTLAHRLPTRDDRWRLFPGFQLWLQGDTAFVSADTLPGPVPLADRLEVAEDGTFRLRGRVGDLVKVAGKRASLAELTARLLAIPGVEDGVILPPGAAGGDRLSALVVAPGLSVPTIRQRLSEAVDPAFLPRPIKLVPELPRSATGKLTRAALDALLESDTAAE